MPLNYEKKTTYFKHFLMHLSLSMSVCIYLSTYIYIYILTYYLLSFTFTRKNLAGTRDNNTSNHCPGKKRKNIIGQKKKKRPTSSHQLKKIKRYTISWSKEKEKPTINSCNATITNCAQYEVDPITKIKSRVGIFLEKFHLNGSSGSIVPTNDKGESTIFINQNLLSWKFT